MKRIGAQLGLGVIALGASGCAAHHGSAHDVPTFRMHAQGQASASADQFEIELSVVSNAASVEDAVRENNSRIARVIDALRDLDLGSDAISSGAFEITPQREVDKDSGARLPNIVGYTVKNSVSIKSTRLAMAGQVIEAGVNAGANEVNYFALGLANPASIRDAALKDAVSNANREAALIAKASGFTLGRVERVDLSSNWELPRNVLVQSGGGSGFFRESTVGETPLIPGAIETNAEVTIEYRIEPR